MQKQKKRRTIGPACGSADLEHRNHAPAPGPCSRLPRGWTGNSTAVPGSAPGPRPFRGVPPVGGASLNTPPLGSLLPERSCGRPAIPKPQLPGRARPRLPERPGRPDSSPQAPARPRYHSRPLPRQRGLHGPLLPILSRRHRPSVAETGTSSAPGRCLHKGAAPPPSALGPPGYGVQRRVAPTPLPPCPARWEARDVCPRGRGVRARCSPESNGRTRFPAPGLVGIFSLASGPQLPVLLRSFWS